MSLDNINWYPGHMKKTMDLIRENLKMVDAVAELVDARIPVSSRNPVLGQLIENKTRILILNKADLADPEKTAVWAEELKKGTDYVMTMNCSSGEGAKNLIRLLEKIRDSRNEGRERQRGLRLMIVGIPNVGKSSLINRLTGSKGAKTGNKPGLTRGKQWLSLGKDMMLLDTPGILWPKFEDKTVGLNLAFCGSIREEILDIPSLGMELIGRLSEIAPAELMARYKLEKTEETPLLTMEAIAQKRGFILSGRNIDYERTAKTVLDEFRSGKIGRISLE